MKVYEHPEYFEIAFSYREIDLEVDFVEQAIRRYSRVPVRVVLELASGTSPHMAELCRRGYRYIGLEASNEMVTYSRGRIRDRGLDAAITEGDMASSRWGNGPIARWSSWARSSLPMTLSSCATCSRSPGRSRPAASICWTGS